MKILQVNKFYYPKLGGIETIVKQISEQLGKDVGWQVDVLACNSRKGVPNLVQEVEGVKVYLARSLGVFFSMPVSINFLFLFRKIAKDYDLIILHHPFPLGFLAYWLFGKKKKMLIWYFSDIIRQRFLGYIIKPLLISVLNSAKAILVYSNSVVTSSAILKVFNKKIIVIPYGLSSSFYKKSLNQEALEIKAEKTTPLILSVGRLVSYKGFEYLIEAMKSVSGNLIIIGSGPLLEKLTTQIKEAKLHDKIKIISSVKDLASYYQAADVFVLPSVTSAETFGLVQLEAMASGLPVINTSLPTAVPEVSINGLTGITVAPRDSGKLAEALNELVNNPSLRKKYSQAAKLRAEQDFSETRFILDMKEVINNLVNEPISN